MDDLDKRDLSHVRRAAAAARWAGHAKQTWRTIRITAEACDALRAVPGETWSDRITRLLDAVKQT